MTDDLMANEPIIRLGSFLGILLAMMAWELLAPRRVLSMPRWLRWPNNLGIVVLNTGLLRLLVPIAAVGAAAFAETRGWGLLNLWFPPTEDGRGWIALLASLLLFDLAIYGQHALFHHVPVLWRLHRLHHADLDYDVTTALRFHPIEILLSMGIKLAMVLLIGPPVVAVLLFEILLNGLAMFNHGNVHMPPTLDAMLRWLIVTPDMHRVHHSVRRHETDSNFGFNLSWWDRLFGTYRAQPEEGPGDGHERMTIGVGGFSTRRDLWLDAMLIQPWRALLPDGGAGPAGGRGIENREQETG